MILRGFLWAISLLAIGFRFVGLERKPPHFDEGVNWFFVQEIKRIGFFEYDPTNYHGPLHFYLLYVFDLFFGDSLIAYRLLPVCVSVLTIFIAYNLAKKVNVVPVFVVAIFATSPAFTFYSRYAIHETSLVFFLLLFFYLLIKFLDNQKVETFFFSGLALVGAAAVKETFVIHVISFVLAFLLIWRTQGVSDLKRLVQSLGFRKIGICLLGWMSVLFLLYTGFGKNLTGFQDFFLAFLPWKDIAIDSGHAKPFYYWLKNLILFEAPLFFGLIFGVLLIKKINQKQRVLMMAGLLGLLFYSVIPYKTPWCLISISWPFAFFCFQNWKSRYVEVLVLVAVLFSSYQSYSLNFKRYTDSEHPYVYVQTSEEYWKVFEILNQIEGARDLEFLVVSVGYWPLPWGLKDFKKTQFLSEFDGEVISPLAIVEIEKMKNLRLGNEYCVIPFTLREAKKDHVLLIKEKLALVSLGGCPGAI